MIYLVYRTLIKDIVRIKFIRYEEIGSKTLAFDVAKARVLPGMTA